MATVRGPAVEPVIAKSGTRLDRDYEQRLADEAEAGFDPATLTRKHAGRPSLSGRPLEASGPPRRRRDLRGYPADRGT